VSNDEKMFEVILIVVTHVNGSGGGRFSPPFVCVSVGFFARYLKN